MIDYPHMGCVRGHVASLNSGKQGVALTGRNPIGPPFSVSRPTAYAAGGWQRYRRRQQTTDASEQNNTGPLGGPVITDNISKTVRDRNIVEVGG